jgi:hypothetical protein
MSINNILDLSSDSLGEVGIPVMHPFSVAPIRSRDAAGNSRISLRELLDEWEGVVPYQPDSPQGQSIRAQFDSIVVEIQREAAKQKLKGVRAVLMNNHSTVALATRSHGGVAYVGVCYEGDAFFSAVLVAPRPASLPAVMGREPHDRKWVVITPMRESGKQDGKLTKMSMSDSWKRNAQLLTSERSVAKAALKALRPTPGLLLRDLCSGIKGGVRDTLVNFDSGALVEAKRKAYKKYFTTDPANSRKADEVLTFLSQVLDMSEAVSQVMPRDMLDAIREYERECADIQSRVDTTLKYTVVFAQLEGDNRIYAVCPVLYRAVEVADVAQVNPALAQRVQTVSIAKPGLKSAYLVSVPTVPNYATLGGVGCVVTSYVFSEVIVVLATKEEYESVFA